MRRYPTMATRRDPLAPQYRRLRAPDLIARYTLFLSSADELSRVRDRVDGLINHAFNPLLNEKGVSIRLIRWEDEPPKKAPTGKVNDRFVQQVRESHRTLVLLQNCLGEGTREELDAALAEDEVQLSVVRFAADQDQLRPDPDEVAAFLALHKGSLLYDESGTPDSDQGLTSLVRILLEVALEACDGQQQEAVLNEVR